MKMRVSIKITKKTVLTFRYKQQILRSIIRNLRSECFLRKPVFADSSSVYSQLKHLRRASFENEKRQT